MIFELSLVFEEKILGRYNKHLLPFFLFLRKFGAVSSPKIHYNTKAPSVLLKINFVIRLLTTCN